MLKNKKGRPALAGRLDVAPIKWLDSRAGFWAKLALPFRTDDVVIFYVFFHSDRGPTAIPGTWITIRTAGRQRNKLPGVDTRGEKL